MLCAIIKKPGEPGDMGFEIEFQGEAVSGIQKAVLQWPRGRAPKSLKRLCQLSWTRNHSYGYVRTKTGDLYKIDGIEGAAGPLTFLYLVHTSEAFKVEAYCKCGGAVKGSVKSKDRKSVESCVEVFWTIHSKEGCGPADAASAARARRKSELKETEGDE